MSLTGPQDAFLELLLNKAIEKGIIVIAADTGLDNKDEFYKNLNYRQQTTLFQGLMRMLLLQPYAKQQRAHRKF